MNNLYIGVGGHIMIDKDTDNVKYIDVTPERISRMFYVQNDTHVVYSIGEEKCEVDAKAGDIVIVFYKDYYKHPVIVVKNDEWKENLDIYNAKKQAEKEEWARKQAECCACNSCEPKRII